MPIYNEVTLLSNSTVIQVIKTQFNIITVVSSRRYKLPINIC